MSRKEKQSQRVDQLEQEFIRKLQTALDQVILDNNGGFFAAMRFQAYPSNFLKRQRRPIETLLELGDEIQSLREKLQIEPSANVAALHRACKEANDYRNDHRLGPRRLAQRLKAELTNEDC